jgi:hypothetical protein
LTKVAAYPSSPSARDIDSRNPVKQPLPCVIAEVVETDAGCADSQLGVGALLAAEHLPG